MLEPTPIIIPAGVVSTPTKKSKSSNWRDGHLIRWNKGKLQPVGGWTQIPYTAFASKCRKIHRWTTNAGVSMVAYLCEGHLYVDQGDGLLTNISPASPISQPSGSLVQGGYGDNTYSLGAYGTPRPDHEDARRRITPGYYLDNWGENIVAMTGTDGRLLMWSPSDVPGTLSDAVSGAPVGNRGFVVTPQRHVILFGAEGIMNEYAWCSQEDIENWNFADVASTAGFNTVQPASPIIACSRSGNDVVFFTEAGHAFYIEYKGLPYIYGGDKFADGVTPYSPMSISDTPDGAIWVSEGGVWTYQSRAVIPVVCDVWNWVDDAVDTDKTRVAAATLLNPSFTEMWWFFTSTGSDDNDRYMIFNYKEKWWSTGYMSRTGGINGTYTGLPLMTDGTNVYQHESGGSYGGADLPWGSTFPISMNYGAQFATFAKMLPDYDGDITAISFTVDYNIKRMGDDTVTTDDKSVMPDGYVHFHVTGRDFRLTVRQTVSESPLWTLGDNNVYMIPRGSQ
jgi:hypothetical protein